MTKTPRKIARKSAFTPRTPLGERVRIESLRKYLRAVTRAAAKGERDLEHKRFAQRCGLSTQYLVQVALGMRNASAETALAVERATYGVIRAEELCPGFDWHYAKLRGLRPVARIEEIPATPQHERSDHHADITAAA